MAVIESQSLPGGISRSPITADTIADFGEVLAELLSPDSVERLSEVLNSQELVEWSKEPLYPAQSKMDMMTSQ